MESNSYTDILDDTIAIMENCNSEDVISIFSEYLSIFHFKFDDVNETMPRILAEVQIDLSKKI